MKLEYLLGIRDTKYVVEIARYFLNNFEYCLWHRLPNLKLLLQSKSNREIKMFCKVM